MQERWKDIVGYENAYQISDCGQVRSKTRTRIEQNCHGGRSPRTDKGKLLSAFDNGSGYLVIALRKNGARKNYYIHRLVAEAFCEKNANDNYVHHKDHNRKNNNASNLEWCTSKENISHSAPLMRHEKRVSRQSNTKEKYISRIKTKGNIRFRVAYKPKKIYRQFVTLQKAIAFRDEVINGDS